MESKKPAKSNLWGIASIHKVIAAQAQALAELAEDVPNYLHTGHITSVLACDTVIFEDYSQPTKCFAWLTAALKSWLGANEGFNRLVGTGTVFRYVILPFPSALGRSWAKRRLLIEIILLHIHLQLWHGVICGVVFLDPRKVSIDGVRSQLSFLAIPDAGILYNLPGFHDSDNIRASVQTGSSADQLMRGLERWITVGGRRPIWLYYDETNFSKSRLRGWRWESLRDFFGSLYGPLPVCIGCHQQIRSFSLDHIAPVSKGHFQTLLNFRPLCRRCNSSKRDLNAEDPFAIRMLLPEELRTRDLDDLIRLSPPWLGRTKMPITSSEVTSKGMPRWDRR